MFVRSGGSVLLQSWQSRKAWPLRSSFISTPPPLACYMNLCIFYSLPSSFYSQGCLCCNLSLVCMELHVMFWMSLVWCVVCTSRVWSGLLASVCVYVCCCLALRGEGRHHIILSSAGARMDSISDIQRDIHPHSHQFWQTSSSILANFCIRNLFLLGFFSFFFRKHILN